MPVPRNRAGNSSPAMMMARPYWAVRNSRATVCHTVNWNFVCTNAVAAVAIAKPPTVISSSVRRPNRSAHIRKKNDAIMPPRVIAYSVPHSSRPMCSVARTSTDASVSIDASNPSYSVAMPSRASSTM